MRTAVRTRVARLRQPVTQRLPDPDPATRAWVWVLPLPDGRVRVAHVAVPRHLLEPEELCLGEEDVTTTHLRVVDHVDDVDAAVRACGGDPDALASPWRNDFPL